jgi:hypothetical protein
MRIAYLIFAYKNPKLIQKTVERLAGANVSFYIHLDAKSDLARFASLKAQNVFFTNQRIPVFWAEFSGIEAILILIREALAAAECPDYLVLLSGSEYPLRGGKYIQEFFATNRGQEFMTLVKMPNEEAGKPLSRINTLRFPVRRPVWRFVFRALAKLGLAQRNYKRYFGTLEPYSGHTWWALTREACQYIVDFKERDRKLTEFFQNAFAPEETFFHTILGNSPFKSRMRRNLVFEDWSAGGGHPAMISEPHLAFFEGQAGVCVQDHHGPGELLFARKFSDETLGLTERIDAMISRKEGLSCRV